MNKKGSSIGTIVEVIPNLVIIALIASVVFGISSSSYSYEIVVRDVEARVMAKEIAECLSPEGVLDLDKISKDNIVSYCGMDVGDRFYVGVEVLDSSGDKVARFSEGDSGSRWVKDLIRSAVLTGNAVLWENDDLDKIVRYNPGYFEYEYSSFVLDGGNKFEGKVKMEVLVNHEE